MKATEKNDDGIGWLRKLRQKIAVECGRDLAAQSEVYRQAAARHSHKVFKGEPPVAGKKPAAKAA